MRRNQKEEDLRENHPYFDRPLFAVPRESKFRKICQTIVNARYDPKLKAREYRFGTPTHATTYKGQKISPKILRKFLQKNKDIVICTNL